MNRLRRKAIRCSAILNNNNTKYLRLVMERRYTSRISVTIECGDHVAWHKFKTNRSLTALIGDKKFSDDAKVRYHCDRISCLEVESRFTLSVCLVLIQNAH